MRTVLRQSILYSLPVVLGCFATIANMTPGHGAAPVVKAPEQAKTRLCVPPRCYAVVGQELRIYFDNVQSTPPIARERILITKFDLREGAADAPPFGTRTGRYWSLAPTAAQVGKHKLFVFAAAEDGTFNDVAETELCIAPADAGAGRDLNLLIVGDSLTHASLYPNDWSRLLSLPGNPKLTMLGTHKPAGAAPGVAHEGYGGWRWETFETRYEPKPDLAKRIHSSPFVFVGKDGKPGLDVPRYFAEKCDGRKPDVVTFLLGINDCFGAPANDPAALDRHIDGVFAHADRVLAAFHAAAPEADLAVCLTPPANSRDEAFKINYKDKYPGSGWRKIQARLVERQLAHFGGREAERIFVVPTELDIDVTTGYPDNNAVHPNPEGYGRLAASLQAWLKWRMYEATLAK